MSLPSMFAAYALPADPASIFTMVLVLAAVVAVVWFGRGKPT
jgi:hypothetical protein